MVDKQKEEIQYNLKQVAVKFRATNPDLDFSLSIQSSNITEEPKTGRFTPRKAEKYCPPVKTATLPFRNQNPKA